LRVISQRELLHHAEKFPETRASVFNWLTVARVARWSSLEDIRRTFPSADMVGPLAIFNIKGNRYRLIVRIAFRTQRIYIKEFLTHAEYDRKGWMKWL